MVWPVWGTGGCNKLIVIIVVMEKIKKIANWNKNKCSAAIIERNTVYLLSCFLFLHISMVYVLNVMKVPNIRSISTKTSLLKYRCGSSGFLYQSACYFYLSFYIIMMIGVHKNREFSSTRIQLWMCLLGKLTKVFLHFFPNFWHIW